ncbi:MAG: glycosyltransferase family 4 protein [Gaiellaceae bacterium]
MAARPRLLIVITLAEIGGAQTYVAGLLPALSGAFDVTVAAWGPGPLIDVCRANNVSFVPLRFVRRPLSPVYDLLGFFELIRLMRRLRPQIVHANSSKAGVLARLAATVARVPIRIFTVHGWAFKAHHGLASRLYLAADRLMRPLTTMTICVSDTERAAGLAMRTCSDARTTVIKNAVELKEARTDPKAMPPLVLSVGRLKAPKDFSTLVRAMASLPSGSCRLRIAGGGPELAALSEEIGRLRLDGVVELLGDRDDIDELLRQSQLFVLSSRSEGMPMSVLEAMASGVPVVASAVGGIPELVVDGETGLLVEPGDPQGLAAAISRLLEDGELRQRFAAAGHERARQLFDPERWRQEHVNLYLRLLSKHGAQD